MPASQFSSTLAIMASVVPEGPSVELYDEARAERIAEARVQQEEEDEEEEEEEEREDSPQEPTCVRDSMCTRNRAVHCHIGFVTVVEMHAPLLRVPHCVARPIGFVTSVPPGGDDGGPPKKRAYTRRAAPTSAPTVANNPAQTDIISTAASNLITLVSAAHTAAANCTAADPMAAASLGSQLQAWGPGPRSTAAAPTAAASSTAAPTSDVLANDMHTVDNVGQTCGCALCVWAAAEQLQWQQPAHTAINSLLK